MEMHADFGVWMKAVDPREDLDRLTRRWEGLVEVINECDVDVVDHLIRRHFGLSDGNRDMKEWFEQELKTANPFLDLDNAENELTTLASACLAVLMETSKSKWRSHSALAIASTAMRGRRKGRGPIKLADRAYSVLVRDGEAIRQRKPLKSSDPIRAVELDIADKLAETQFSDDDQAKAAITHIVKETAKQITAVKREAMKAVNTLTKHIDMKDEELEILWWAFNEFSEGRQMTFKSLKPAERPVVVGSELAGKTRMLPGPVSARALMAGTGLTTKTKHPISAAIDACDAEWLSTQESSEASDLTPVLAAVSERLRTGKINVWAASWASVTGLDESLNISETEIAGQMYDEVLFLRSRRELAS